MDSGATEVFVSYKAEDRPRVQHLVNALESEGFTVWWDAHIGAGTGWRQDIEEHLASAKCVIVVWSKRSIGAAGDFVKDEANRAQRAGTYLPVRIDRVDPPLGFGEVQALSLEGWKGKAADPRFQSVVAAVRAKLEGRAIPQGIAHPGPAISRRTAMIGGGVAAVAVAGGAGYWIINGTGAQASTRIAVLPFSNLSGDASQDFFSEGLSEELRGALSRVGLQVIGRNSSDAVAKDDAATIVKKLDVSHILNGSVRKSTDKIRVSTQLVDGRDGVEKWAQNYDRPAGEVIEVQTDIATHVAQALTVALGSSLTKAIELGGTKDPVAQEFYQQASDELKKAKNNQASASEAISLLNKAVSRDPKFAKAWVRLGNIELSYAGAYAVDEADKSRIEAGAEQKIRRGIALAPDLPIGPVALSRLEFQHLKMRLALGYAERAYALAPNDPEVLRGILELYLSLAARRTLPDLLERLISSDPLYPSNDRFRSQVARQLRNKTDAVRFGERALRANPEGGGEQNALTAAYLLAGRDNDAARVVAAIPEGDWSKTTYEAILAARSGNKEVMDKRVARLKAEDGDLAAYQYGQIFAQAGDRDAAFAALETAERLKDFGLVDVKYDFLMEPLHVDPRFTALIKRLDFPDG